jgi:hypothetical protein
LLRVAKERAIAEKLGAVAFVQADAQTYAFEAVRFHAVMSRFGVMFFDGSRGSVRQYQARDTIRRKACRHVPGVRHLSPAYCAQVAFVTRFSFLKWCCNLADQGSAPDTRARDRLEIRHQPRGTP